MRRSCRFLPHGGLAMLPAADQAPSSVCARPLVIVPEGRPRSAPRNNSSLVRRRTGVPRERGQGAVRLAERGRSSQRCGGSSRTPECAQVRWRGRAFEGSRLAPRALPFHLTPPPRSPYPRRGSPAAASPRTPASYLPWSRTPPLPGIPSRGAQKRNKANARQPTLPSRIGRGDVCGGREIVARRP